MNKNILKATIISAALLACIPFVSCTKNTSKKDISIAVFVPGITSDSPTYANLVNGVKEAVEIYESEEHEKRVSVRVMEAGTNQSEWGPGLTALSASGMYDVIVSSNESIPEIAEPLTVQFPKQKFILMHGVCDGNQSIYCVNYDQREQVYVSGYLSSLMSKTHKVAVVAAQEYPAMNNVLYPYYKLGASEAVPGTTCDFRIVGNWYDASKGAQIADALFSKGVDVIMPICGGAAQGVIASAKEHGTYLSFIDENSFAKAPGVVISSCSTKQALATKEAVLEYLHGQTHWGTTRSVGMKDGYIEFIQDDPLYIETIPSDIRKKMSDLIDALHDGSIQIR